MRRRTDAPRQREALPRRTEENKRPPPRSARAEPARVCAKRSTKNAAKAQLSLRLANAAVAAGGAGPPGVVTGRHRTLKLVDVADEITLAAVECLLEFLELCAPAFDLVFAVLNVGLELGLALLELRLTLLELD